MKKLMALSVFLLWTGTAQGAEVSSDYTKFDLDTCQVIKKGDEYVFAGVWKCKGLKGIDIFQASSDDRGYAAFGKDGTGHCAFRKTFSPLNSALSPIEWRLRDGKPFAAIERWSVVNDENGNSVTWLVVSAIKANDSCHIHYVAGSYPDANADARRAADDLAADFNCDSNAPTVDSKVGPPPIDLSACKDLPNE